MSYAIMRLEKRNINNIIAMFKHNERKNKNYSNEDINQELTHLNYDLIKCSSYKKKIDEELEKRYTSSRSIRRDAVLCVEVIFTSDNEFFKKLTFEQEKLYFEKSLEFLQDFVNKENVISAVVHKDETTPHMHCVFTPITKDGRLHFKSFIKNRYDLIKLQDKYYEKIVNFFPELQRGKSAKETQRKHLTTEQYKYYQKMVKGNEILEDFLKELEKIGYENLNDVNKKFVKNCSQIYDTAKKILK